jgi:hypothetical protein
MKLLNSTMICISYNYVDSHPLVAYLKIYIENHIHDQFFSIFIKIFLKIDLDYGIGWHPMQINQII